jgi:hypothetical protein
MAPNKNIMGFDQNDSRPIIKPAKKTTKVNLAMVAAVLIFFGLGVGAICWMKITRGHP